MRYSLTLLIGLCTLTVTAAPAPNNHYVSHEKRHSLSSAWSKADRVHKDVKLPMRVGLTQSNLDKGHELLMDVSDPASPRYAQHYTAEEVIDIFAPAAETVEAVSKWLHSAGIEAARITHSVNKQWLGFDATTAEAEELLQTEYHFYEHARTGENNIACDEYNVPAHVKQHIDYITPGIKLLAAGSTSDKREIEKRTFGINGIHRGPLKAPLPMPLASLLALPLTSICDVAIIP